MAEAEAAKLSDLKISEDKVIQFQFLFFYIPHLWPIFLPYHSC